MKRDIASLSEREFDLVIVGGGIFGVCAAWEATSRGLSVALLERGDFAHAASANCFKMVHGGIRYLQHGDIYRVRESSHERSAFLRIAPHLVEPLPILVPTYGKGLKGKAFLNAGLKLYDAVTFDRNSGISDSQRHIPGGYSISTDECLDRFPGLDSRDLTGGVVFYDGHMYSPPRLALAFLKSTTDMGAVAANYVEAVNFLRNGDTVVGVQAHDTLTDEYFDVRGKMVMNAAGGWAENLLRQGATDGINPSLTFSRDACLVINRRLTDRFALAVQGATKDPDALVNRGNRHLFIVPWRDYTLVGVWHVVHQGHPDDYTLTEREIQAFLDEFNASYDLDEPLTLSDVSMWNAGLVLFGENQEGSTNLSYGKRSRIVDHTKEDGIEGLVTVVGVRYTTARGVGEKAINMVLKKLGANAPKSSTAHTPISGGDIGVFDDFVNNAVQQRPVHIGADSMISLARNHGTCYPQVLGYIDESDEWAETLGDSNVIKAEVVYAVRQEAAQKLGDVVFRRTDLGSGSHPGEIALRECADVMGRELGWSQDRIRQELEEVNAAFPDFAKVAV